VTLILIFIHFLIEENDPRPLCWYGSLCYRKNPEHLKQFRHPGDPVPQSEKKELPAKTASKVVDDKKISENVIDLTYENDFDEGTPKPTISKSTVSTKQITSSKPTPTSTTTSTITSTTTDNQYKGDSGKGKENATTSIPNRVEERIFLKNYFLFPSPTF
jgi:hypothetical protein